MIGCLCWRKHSLFTQTELDFESQLCHYRGPFGNGDSIHLDSGEQRYFLLFFLKSWFICCLAVWLSVRFAASQFLQWKIISVAYFTFTVYSYSEDLIRAKVSLCTTQASPCSAELIAWKLFEIILNGHYKACVKSTLTLFHLLSWSQQYYISPYKICLGFLVCASSCTSRSENSPVGVFRVGLLASSVNWYFPWLSRIFFCLVIHITN